MRNWYRIENQADSNVADIHIFDFIGDWIDHYWGFGVSAKQFLDELARLPDSVRTIRLHVNSPGGDAFAAQAIASMLRDQRMQKGRTVEVLIEGLAASAASIVTSAGKPVRIGDNALMMIHNPWTIAGGESRDLRKAADSLDKIRSAIIAAYRWRSELSEADLGELMDDVTWMDADEAILYGFADEKVTGFQAVASLFDPAGMAKFPDPPEKYRVRAAAIMGATIPEPGEGIRIQNAPEWKVGGDKDLTLDEERDWDGDAADGRVRKWASSDGSGDKEQMDWPKYRKSFVVYDAANEENFDGYKLGFADMIEGDLTAIKAGLVAVRVVLGGGRGGIDLPDDVIEDAKKFVDSYLGEQKEDKAQAASADEVLAAVEAAGLSTACARELIQTALPMHQISDRIAVVVQEREQTAAREKEIRALCAIAKYPEMADGYIRGGMSTKEVKAQLTILTAKLDKAEIDSALLPDGSKGGKARIDIGAVYAERNRLTTTTKEG
jgi:ATP-dependent Clp protease protease subunit